MLRVIKYFSKNTGKNAPLNEITQNVDICFDKIIGEIIENSSSSEKEISFNDGYIEAKMVSDSIQLIDDILKMNTQITNENKKSNNIKKIMIY